MDLKRIIKKQLLESKTPSQGEYNRTLLKLIETCDELTLVQNSKMLTENKKQLLEVSLWDKAKGYMAKLGRYKAGGKILGKGKVDAEAAEKILQLLTKKGNEMLKVLHDEIQTLNKQGEGGGTFPNNVDPMVFLSVIETIAKVYDSIVEASKIPAGEKGSLPIDMANNLIVDLREYVKKYLDIDLAAVYSGLDEQDEPMYDMDYLSEDEESEMRDKLSAKGGEEEIGSQRMDTLKSNKLPMLLAGVGASLGGLSWLADTDWFRSLFTKLHDIKEVEVIKSTVEEALGTIRPGEGTTQILSRVFDGVDLDLSDSPEEFLEAVKEVGDGSIEKGIELMTQDGGLYPNPSAARETLQAIAADPHAHGDTLGEIFKGDWAGTGESASDTLTTITGGQLSGMIATAVAKIVVKQVAKVGAGYLVAKGLGAALGPIGVALIGTGALVKLFRMKGQKQSRAATLNLLLQSLQKVEGGTGIIDPPQPDGDPDPEGEIDPPQPEDPKPEQPVDGPIPGIDKTFLKGNRDMQMSSLAKTFLAKGDSIWSRLSLKDNSILPSGFFNAALKQGEVKADEYLGKLYNKLGKEGAFTKQIPLEDWISTIRTDENMSLIRWARNTRKNIGSFLKALKKQFPEFEIGERAKGMVGKPGDRGQAMAESRQIIVEANLGGLATKAGFSEKEFMKKLPQFIEMLNMMYYDTNGKDLGYNREAVVNSCKDYGCKGAKGGEGKPDMSPDYGFIKEELTRIKRLM